MRMRRNLAIGVFVGLLSACGGGGGGGRHGIEPIPFPLPPFDAARFVTGVTNPFFPLVPGRKLTYRMTTDEGVEQTVDETLPATKEILGVTCTIVHSVVTLNGSLIEDTFDWYAQDVDGNVWYLGEDTKQFANGVQTGTDGSFEAGVAGAAAGILVLGAPSPGLTYSEEVAPGVAEDMATVEALGAFASVPFGVMTGCLETSNFTPLEPGLYETKFYAPGVGIVLEIDPDGDRNELISVTP